MKKHISTQIGCLLFFICSIFTFSACQHELQEISIPPQIIAHKNIQEAKIWFENYQKSGAIDRSSKFNGMRVQWDKALTVGSTVEVPFMVNDEFNFPSLYNDRNFLGKQRLVIYKDSKNDKKAYIFEYMPSKAFNGNIYQINSANFKSKKFDGILAVHTFDSQIVRGFIWEQGKIVKEIHYNTQDISSRTCTVTTYQYACGSVYNGPLQCSTGYTYTCWSSGYTGGGYGGGDDSCLCCYIGCGDKDTDDSGFYQPNETGPTGAIELVIIENLSPCSKNVLDKIADNSEDFQGIAVFFP